MISVILGLGNVGDVYQSTRHNLGFQVVALVSRLLKAKKLADTELNSVDKAVSGTGQLFLARPKSLMNRSGLAAAELVAQHELAPSELLVVMDDFNLPLGRIRVRSEGSDGGHNGLASVIECLGTESFPRLRLGIGPLPAESNPADFVLARFAAAEKPAVEEMVAEAAKAVLFAIEHPLERVMSKYNTNPAPPELS